jgi:hypothetical protein
MLELRLQRSEGLHEITSDLADLIPFFEMLVHGVFPVGAVYDRRYNGQFSSSF